jgi:hypothetical protein
VPVETAAATATIKAYDSRLEINTTEESQG